MMSWDRRTQILAIVTIMKIESRDFTSDLAFPGPPHRDPRYLRADKQSRALAFSTEYSLAGRTHLFICLVLDNWLDDLQHGQSRGFELTTVAANARYRS